MTRRLLSAFSAGAEPPSDPFNGEHWIDTTTGIDYTWTEACDYWVEGGTSELFPSSPAPEIGDRFDYDAQQWRWNGRGWAKLKLLRADGDDVVVDQNLVVPSLKLGDDDLSESLEAIAEVISELQANVYQLQSDVGELQANVYQLQSDVGALQTDIDGGTF